MAVFRHKNRWCAEIATGERTPSGNIRRRRRYARTKVEAERFEREMLQLRDTGYPVPARDLTVATYLQQWLASVEGSGRKESTKVNYRSFVNGVLVPQIGHIKLAELHQRHVNALLKNLQMTKSPSSMRLARTTLSVALNQAMRLDLITRNVAQLADPVQGTRRKPLRVDVQDVENILSVAGDHYLADAIRVIMSTGIRRGEACALTWGDIHLDQTPSYLVVNKAVAPSPGGFAVTTPKTESSNRIVPLKDDVANVLRQRRQRHLEIVGGDRISDAFVFGEDPMTFPRPDTLTSVFARFGREAGINGFGPHQLRHLHSSVVLAVTDNISMLSKSLGHTNVRTTSDQYGHQTHAMLIQMKAAIETALPSQPQQSDQGDVA